MRIISGCRIEVSRDAIASSCDFAAAEHISNLSRLCLIEVVSPSTIRLPGVLRGRFRFNDLDEETKNSLHRNAAMMYSQMLNEHPSRLEFAVEAEYHATLIGQVAKVATGLKDGCLAAARAFYEAHNFERAHQVLEPLINSSPSYDIPRLSALIDAERGDLTSALSKAEKILESNPSDSHLFFVLGKATLSQSRPQFGDRLVWIGRKAGVAETKISVLEGRLALRRRDFEKAEYCFRQALTSPTPDPWAYFFLGRTYLRNGSLNEAIDVLYEGDKYLTSNPRLRGKARDAIRTQLGVAYVLNGDIDPASYILEDRVKQDPNNPETLYAYWLLIVRRDGIEKASEAFDVFKTAKPKRWEKGYYHLYYGLFLKALDKLTEANEHFALAHQYEPCNVYIMIQYAETLYDLAMRARNELETELSKNRAIKSAWIVRRIFDFDSDNHFAQDLQVDLYLEFDIELSKLEK